MRITRTEYTPIDVLSELITPRGITAPDTKRYFSGERSSHDWLVTAWAEKLEVVLTFFRRYGTEVAETQFIRDHGVDVRLCYAPKSDTDWRVGFQIKSNQEAIKDAKRPRAGETMISTLKRQAFEAQRYGGVNEWWIVSCFDLATHRKLVSAINAEVTGGKSAGWRMRQIGPREVMAFLQLPDEEIDALCTLLLCKDDEVLQLARREVWDLDHAAQLIVLHSLGPALEGNRELSLRELREVADPSTTDDDDLVRDVNALETDGFLNSNGADAYTIEPSVYVGLCALYFEARARHQYDPSNANKFVRRMTEDCISSAPES
jgi:hypothetical protein